MNLTEITTMLSTFAGIITSLGGFGVWLYRKQAKRLREAETQLAEVQVDKARIESKADEFHIWKEQCEALSGQNRALIERNTELVRINADKEDRHQQDIKDWEERFTNQTTYLRGVQRDLIESNEREKEHIRREAQLERERDHYKMWMCRREHISLDPLDGCGRRLPQQLHPIKYIGLDEFFDIKDINEEVNINLEK